MTVTDAEIGERVHHLMWRQRLSQTALASILGLTQGTVSKKLRGSTAWFATELITVADALGTSVEELLPRLDSNQKPFDYRSAALTLVDRLAAAQAELVAA